MRTLVVDDEPLAREGLRLMLAAHPALEVVGEAGDARQALELIAQTQPELLLIDVQMPEMNGLELAAALPPDPPVIIFVTAHERYALGAFEVQALDYLLKPVDDRRLAVALARARAVRQRAPQRLLVRDRQSLVYLGLDEIDWIEAADYYVEIHTGAKTWLHREPLQSLEQRLGEEHFVRIHRSRLVRRDRIREVRWDRRGEMYVILADGTELGVARSCRARLNRGPP